MRVRSKTLVLSTTSRDSISSIKQSVCDREGFPLPLFRLSYARRQLDDHAIVGECGIQRDCTLTVEFRPVRLSRSQGTTKGLRANLPLPARQIVITFILPILQNHHPLLHHTTVNSRACEPLYLTCDIPDLSEFPPDATAFWSQVLAHSQWCPYYNHEVCKAVLGVSPIPETESQWKVRSGDGFFWYYD